MGPRGPSYKWEPSSRQSLEVATSQPFASLQLTLVDRYDPPPFPSSDPLGIHPSR